MLGKYWLCRSKVRPHRLLGELGEEEAESAAHQQPGRTLPAPPRTARMERREVLQGHTGGFVPGTRGQGSSKCCRNPNAWCTSSLRGWAGSPVPPVSNESCPGKENKLPDSRLSPELDIRRASRAPTGCSLPCVLTRKHLRVLGWC